MSAESTELALVENINDWEFAPINPDLDFGVVNTTYDPKNDIGDIGVVDPKVYDSFRVGIALRRASALAKTAGPPNPSGLRDDHRIIARDMTVEAARLGLRHAPAIYYSQNARLRWTAIRDGDKAWKGEYAANYDCSSFVTWCEWNGLDHYHCRDRVNGLAWKAGYTGTMLSHGVAGTKTLMRGDAVIYGRSWPGLHTAIHVGGGLVISMGSDKGPLLLPLRYRTDVLAVRRYI